MAAPSEFGIDRSSEFGAEHTADVAVPPELTPPEIGIDVGGSPGQDNSNTGWSLIGIDNGSDQGHRGSYVEEIGSVVEGVATEGDIKDVDIAALLGFDTSPQAYLITPVSEGSIFDEFAEVERTGDMPSEVPLGGLAVETEVLVESEEPDVEEPPSPGAEVEVEVAAEDVMADDGGTDNEAPSDAGHESDNVAEDVAEHEDSGSPMEEVPDGGEGSTSGQSEAADSSSHPDISGADVESTESALDAGMLDTGADGRDAPQPPSATDEAGAAASGGALERATPVDQPQSGGTASETSQAPEVPSRSIVTTVTHYNPMDVPVAPPGETAKLLVAQPELQGTVWVVPQAAFDLMHTEHLWEVKPGGPDGRGYRAEDAAAAVVERYVPGTVHLRSNYPTIDLWHPETRTVISVKSIDPTLASYRNPADFAAKMREYLRHLKRYAPTSVNGRQIYGPVQKTLLIALPDTGFTKGHAEALANLVKGGEYDKIAISIMEIPR